MLQQRHGPDQGRRIFDACALGQSTDEDRAAFVQATITRVVQHMTLPNELPTEIVDTETLAVMGSEGRFREERRAWSRYEDALRNEEAAKRLLEQVIRDRIEAAKTLALVNDARNRLDFAGDD